MISTTLEEESKERNKTKKLFYKFCVLIDFIWYQSLWLEKEITSSKDTKQWRIQKLW